MLRSLRSQMLSSHMQLGGGVTEKAQGRFGDAKSMPQITGALKKAAYDPRVSGILLKVSPLSAGWAKLQEIRQYIEFFRSLTPSRCPSITSLYRISQGLLDSIV